MHGKQPSNFASRVSGSHFIANKQENIINLFIDAARKEDEEVAGFLKKINEITRIDDKAARDSANAELLRNIGIDGIYIDYTKAQKYIEALSKMINIAQRSRRVANAEIFEQKKTGTAESFVYVLRQAKQAGLSPKELADFFKSNAVAMFSLTAHPTNATTLEFTKKSLQLHAALDSKADEGTISALMIELYKTPITGGKKSQADEMQETVLALDSVYHSLPFVRKSLDEAFKKAALPPAYKEAFNIEKPLVEPCVWATGDGDGNPNATAESLKEGIAILRNRIKELYLNDIKKLSNQPFLPEKARVIKRLLEFNYQTPDQLINDLQTIGNTQQLQEKVRTFGFHYAKIDIRHNSDDIMTTILSAAKAAGLELSSENYAEQLTKWLQNPEILARLRNVDASKLDNKTAANIFSRLQVIGQNPDMSDKFIIAETNAASNALAALLLLKITRPENTPVNMDVVTLSESVDDLKQLENITKELINNPVYSAHILQRKCFMPMIAKSDTVRRDGVGAVSAQEHAIGIVHKIVQDKFGNNVVVKGYSGGGCALQRGGGNVLEVAHNIGRAASMEGATTMGPTTLTIQGLQQQSLLPPGLITHQSLEALISQNVYALMHVARKPNNRPYVKPLSGHAEIPAQQQAFACLCEKAIESYRHFVGNVDRQIDGKEPFSPLNLIFEAGSYIPARFGNVSSRPDKRSTTEGGNTAIGLIGKKPLLWSLRAIGCERVSGHSGLHFLNYLGLREAMAQYSPKELHEMYKGSKSCRDLMRNVATALHMTDFDKAWFVMSGDKRPCAEKIQELANQYEANPQAANKYQALAFIEQYANDTAKLVYSCINGREAAKDNFTIKTPLQKNWPDMAEQLQMRSRLEEAAHIAEAGLMRVINNNPEVEMASDLVSFVKVTYSACDIGTNAPENTGNTLTRVQEVCQHSKM